MRNNLASSFSPDLNRHAGFTLVELIVVIAITGIIAAVVAVFIRAPVEGYLDSARRAELTDVADTALRRMSRDIHSALPNSLRTNGSAIEFLQTRTGGRYRSEPATSGATVCGVNLAGDILDFGAADTCFEVLGTLDTTPATGDRVVVYNLGISGANAYAGDNTATVAAGTTTGVIKMSPAKRFPFESPVKRFQIVSGPVIYACSGVGSLNGNGTGTLMRYSGYGINPSLTVPSSGGVLIADHVSACSIVYTQGATERSGIASMQLQMRKEGESISLYHEVHVDNVP